MEQKKISISGQPNTVPTVFPLFPQLRELLEKIKAQYPNAKPTDKVLPSHFEAPRLAESFRALESIQDMTTRVPGAAV